MTRTKIAVGSIVGALVLHVVMVACGSAGPMMGDAGVLADMRDAVVDVLRDVADAETPDAHAGGDGGVSACACLPTVETTFTVNGVTRDGRAETPMRDYSTAGLDVFAVPLEDERSRDPAAVGPGHSLRLMADFRTTDGSRVFLRCADVTVRPNRTLFPGMSCALQLSRLEASGDGGVRRTAWIAETSDPENTVTIEVARLEDSRVEVRLTGLRLAARTHPGTTPQVLSIDSITITTTRSSGSFLTPGRALR